MEKKEITISIRFTSKQDQTFKITLSPDNTLSDLKALCVEKSGLDVSEQRMVFRGKILKNDDDTIEAMSIQDGCTINLIQIKTNKTTELNPNVLPTNYSTGGHGLLNQMGFSSNPSAQSNEMANNPFFKEMMKSMLQNPQLMQSILENDPTYSQMLKEHPEIKGMLSDPTTLSMLSDPQVLNSAINMANRSNGMPIGAMSGNLSNFPMPGGNESTTNANNSTGNANQNTNTNPMNQQQRPMMFPPFGGFNMLGAPNNNLNQQQRPMMFPPFGVPNNLGNNLNNTNQVNPQQSPMMFPPFGAPNNNANANNTNPNPNSNPINNPMMFPPFGFNPFLNMNPQNNFQNPLNQQNNVPAINLEEKYKDQLSKLEEMGFSDKTKNLEALKATNGNVEAAIERMMSLFN